MTKPEKPDVMFGTYDAVADMLSADPNVALMVIELGSRGRLRASDVVMASEALTAAVAKLTEQQTLALTISGYDQDPRELYDVPEVVQFVRRVMKHAGITSPNHRAVRMLNEESLALLILCGVFGRDHPWQLRHIKRRDLNMFQRWKP